MGCSLNTHLWKLRNFLVTQKIWLSDKGFIKLDITHMNCWRKTKLSHAKHLLYKKVRPIKVESYCTWKLMHEQIGDSKIWYQNLAKRLSILNMLYTTLNTLCIASYCFQGSNGLANLLSAKSFYKFHILKD